MNSKSSRSKTKTLFGEIAIREYLVSREVFEKALNQQEKAAKAGTPLYVGQIMVNNGDLTPQQVAMVLDIQNQLLREGIANPEWIATDKGDETLRKARQQVTLRHALPWVLGILVAVCLLIIGVLIFENKTQAPGIPSPAVGPIPETESRPARTVQPPAPTVPIPSGARTPGSGIPSGEVPSAPAGKDASLEQQVARLVDRKTPFLERQRLLQELTEFPEDQVRGEMEKIWESSNPEDHRLLVLVVNFLFNGNPEATRETLTRYLRDPGHARLGYASLLTVMNRVRREPFLRDAVLSGLQSKDPFIQDKAVFAATRMDSKWDGALIESLWQMAASPDDDRLSLAALKALYGEGGHRDIERLLDLLPDAKGGRMELIVSILLKSGEDSIFSKMTALARTLPMLRESLIRHLRTTPHAQGEAFLLEQLDKAGSVSDKREIIRSLTAYDSPRVLREFVSLLDQDVPVQEEAIRALRRITGRNFGYRFDASSDENREALGQWRDFAGTSPPPPGS